MASRFPGRRETQRWVQPTESSASPSASNASASAAHQDARGPTRTTARSSAAAAALERAVVLVGPRASWCAALADAFDALGEAELSVGWTQRCVSLRPGNREAIGRLVDRLSAAKDPSRLSDALAWLLSQPQPVAWLAEPFARALRALAELDPDRAAVVARRTLDVLGPDAEPVREAMLDVAERASDHGFAAATFERWLSCGARSANREALYVKLADLQQRLGDEESEARVVARAIHEGVASPALDAHLERLAERPATPDTQLWRMQAKAERLGDPAASASAWRELGAALWDLADDRARAIEAWRRAARLTGSQGYTTFALDLVAFSDTKFAFEWMRS